MTLEREDIGGSANDPLLVPMRPVAAPYGEARDDYAIFADLAERLGAREAFTEGRSVRQWLEHLYAPTREGLAAQGLPAPSFAEFWDSEGCLLPQQADDGGYLRAFRDDPKASPLPTPSGRLEIYSETIASFGEADCPGHPTWLGAAYVGDETTPYVLIANQPRTRLHSQFDFGGHSGASKHRGREVATMHHEDAKLCGISEGDIIRLSNERGACLASVTLSDGIRRGVIQLPTGAWYDPADPGEDKPLCVHGNPNVLTRDVGTSALAQGCTGQLTTVQVQRFDGNLPPIQAYDPPILSQVRTA
jgi:biotin/methionine sulfoxide reductase